MRSGIGDRPERREDLRFLTGQGRYLDELAFEGVTHAVVLRSPHAHAEIRAIDTAAAKRMRGVLAVLTAADAEGDGLKPLLPYVDANTVTGEPFAFIPQPLLAEAKVRYVGEPVALIVGESRDQAFDAAERVAVDYAPLPAVTTGAAARMPGAPLLSSDVPGNLCFEWHAGDAAAVKCGFAAATHVVSLAIDNHRVVTNPMEPRGVVGEHDAATGRYTAYVSAQSLHATRDHAARALGIEPAQLRFVARDVGGGFGAKNFIYPEQVLIPWAAKRVGRPVKWIAGRGEVFVADHQGRDHQAEAQLALDAEGHFLALRIRSVANLGAYLSGSAGGVQTFRYAFLPGAVYRIPAIELIVAAVFTNKAPIGVFAARRTDSERRGRLRGLGLAYHIKATGGAPSENVDVRFEADGMVSLITGTQTIGQGHETTLPQILADRLGLPNDMIRLVQGDTDVIPMGGGHGSSRATYMGGTAIWRAADIIIEKGRHIAAEALEAAEADIRFEDGQFVVAGTDRAIDLLRVARIAAEAGDSLDTYYAWTREWMTFPNGAHVVEVEIDPETGAVTLARYTAVDDYGVMVNPMVASGQAHGAMAQGIGQALLDAAHYDPESGQVVAGSGS